MPVSRRALPAGLLLAALLAGQQQPAFEAASIRALKSSEGTFHFNVFPNRLDVKDMNLRFLIEEAYDLPDFQLSGPDSLGSRHFDIAATTGAPVSRAEMRILLRNLLIERFHLATHRDTRTESLYRLEALPGGPTMKASDVGYASPNSPTAGEDYFQLTGPMSLRQLAERLTRFAGKPVLDTTGIEGYFTVVLKFAREGLDATAGTLSTAPPLNEALQKQLGLKLVPAKEPVEILVVDHVDDVPVEN